MTERHISTAQDLTHFQDQFVADGCRVRLLGPTLIVEALTTTANEEAVADAYLSSLKQQFPLMYAASLGQLGQMLPTVLTVKSPSKREMEVAQSRMKAARNSLVQPYSPSLGRCYDYMQAAQEHPDQALVSLYKMIEVMEDVIGSGEAGAVAVLGSNLKELKRLANDPIGDQRHAPTERAGPSREVDPYGCLNGGEVLLRRFEDWVVAGSGFSTNYERHS